MSVVYVSVASLAMNLVLGKFRANYRKMSLPWWLLIHASIPVLIPLRIWLDTPVAFIPLFIAIAILGQFIGSRYLVRSGRALNTDEEHEISE